MYDVGHTNLTNIDISEVVINQMIRQYKDRQNCKWLQMDATKMSFENESYSVVLDKGTLDAMMSEDSDSVHDMVRSYFSEVARVLKTMGRFVCVSLLQEHIIKALLDYFPAENFLFRVVRCLEAEQKTSSTNEDGSSMPVFLVIATKFSKLPTKMFEISHDGETIDRLKDEAALTSSILTVQRAAMIRNGLIRKSNFDDEINFDLFRPNEKTPRYSLFILDQKASTGGNYAAFICPQGRETEWLFATKQGRRQLLQSAQHSRLAIVTMHRNQEYSSLDDVKLELNETVKSFAPKGLKDAAKIPFLSLGSDVGSRTIVHKGTSELSGDFVVEDVMTVGKTYRRLVFLNNQSVIQSEALLRMVKKKTVVDYNYLSCQHHVYMCLGIESVNQTNLKNLVVGLGGGGLLNYISHNLKHLHMVTVEIDPEIVKVAKDHFGLLEDATRLEIVVDDGLKYLKQKASEKSQFQTVLFDVDSKDQSLGISCPPKEFLELDVLRAVLDLLPSDGVFILNFVCRDNASRDQTIKTLRQVFKAILSYKLEEDVNEIFFCFKSPVEDFKEKFKKSGLKLNSIKRGLVDLPELLEKLELN